MLRDQHQRNRQHGDDRVQPELRELKMRQREQTGLLYRLKIHNTENRSRNIPADDGDQNGNNRKEVAEQDGAEHRNPQRNEKNDGVFGVYRCNHLLKQSRGALDRHIAGLRQNSGGGCRRAGKLQTDQRDDRAHRGRRKKLVDPVGAEPLDDQCQNHHQAANRNKAALRIGKPAAGRVLIPVDDDEGRADERKAGTEVRRAFSLCNPKEKQCADAVHQKNDRGVDPKQRGNQHRRAEHCEHVLYAQRDRLPQRRLFMGLNDVF